MDLPAGSERYAQSSSTYSTHSTYDDDGQQALTARVDAGARIDRSGPPEAGAAAPFWELTFFLRAGQSFNFRPGRKYEMPSGFDFDPDEYVNDFYYFEHETTDQNVLEILAVDGQDITVAITGIRNVLDTEFKLVPAPVRTTAILHFGARTTRSSS